MRGRVAGGSGVHTSPSLTGQVTRIKNAFTLFPLKYPLAGNALVVGPSKRPFIWGLDGRFLSSTECRFTPKEIKSWVRWQGLNGSRPSWEEWDDWFEPPRPPRDCPRLSVPVRDGKSDQMLGENLTTAAVAGSANRLSNCVPDFECRGRPNFSQNSAVTCEVIK
jgi:hypothetical protein